MISSILQRIKSLFQGRSGLGALNAMQPSIHKQRGNVVLGVFAAVAAVGVLGVGTMELLRGPLNSAVMANRQTTAESYMNTSAQMISRVSANYYAGPNEASCDTDSRMEPLPYLSASPNPAGGGQLPADIGATTNDPWGTPYGYCVWDHGSDVCGGNRSTGTDTGVDTAITIAVISAGSNQTFETTCQDFPSTPLSRAPGSDDIVHTLDYDSALGSNGLWEPIGSDTASINKNIKTTGRADFGVASSFDNTAAQQGVLEAERGIRLGQFNSSNEPTCNGAVNDRLLIYDDDVDEVKICNNDAGDWEALGGASGTTLGSISPCSDGEILKYDTTSGWACETGTATTDVLADLESSCSEDQLAEFDGTNWVCSDGVSNEDVSELGTEVATRNTTASGSHSTAFGENTTASGNNSTAFGDSTIAEGSASFAIGKNTHAIGYASFAAGLDSVAEGDQSVAMGNGTLAFGANSLAIGGGTEARGSESFAGGLNTQALGNHSVALGNSTVATNPGAFAIGLSTRAEGNYSFAAGDTTQALGNHSFAAGKNTEASGANSFAVGLNTLASGAQSAAFGNGTTASGDQSVAFGNNTVASNPNSFAVGIGSQAIGDESFATGKNTIASGTRSVAMGEGTEANNTNTVAIGFNTTASGLNGFAVGNGTTASGAQSFAGGESTQASEANSFAVGLNTTASGRNSIAIGKTTTASGSQSFAAGEGSVASGVNSFAMGLNVEANGLNSTAIGENIIVDGDQSFGVGLSSGGPFTVSDNNVMVVMGGKVGVDNNNPSEDLEVSGNVEVQGGSVIESSDRRLKTEIKPLENSLNKIIQLRGISYKWKDKSLSRKQQMGLIAQEVETVYPELVHTSPHSPHYKSVNYSGLVAPLVESVKTLDRRTQTLDAKISAIEEQAQSLSLRAGFDAGMPLKALLFLILIGAGGFYLYRSERS